MNGTGLPSRRRCEGATPRKSGGKRRDYRSRLRVLRGQGDAPLGTGGAEVGGDLPSQDKPGLQSGSQTSPGYIVRLCSKNSTNKTNLGVQELYCMYPDKAHYMYTGVWVWLQRVTTQVLSTPWLGLAFSKVRNPAVELLLLQGCSTDQNRPSHPSICYKCYQCSRTESHWFCNKIPGKTLGTLRSGGLLRLGDLATPK